MITLRFWGTLDTFSDLGLALHGALDSILTDSKIVDQDMIFTLDDNSTLTMHIPNMVQNPKDFQFLLKEFILYITQIPTQNNDVKIGLIQQFTLFNTMLEINFSTSDDARLEYLFVCIVKATGVLNGVLVLPNYNILDGCGNLILSHDGLSDFNFFSPDSHLRQSNSFEYDFSIDDENRFSISKNILSQKSIPFDADNSNSLRKGDCVLRTVEEVARRIVALYSVAFFSEYMLTFDSNIDVAYSELDVLNEIFNFTDFLSDSELFFLNSDVFDPDLGLAFSYCYEAVAVLFWVFGLFEDIGDPIDICDIDSITDIIRSFSSIDDLISGCNLRDFDELLQEQDIIMHYHWACVNSTLSPKLMPLNFNIVAQRHHTLNWVLTNYYGDDWDEIITPF